MKKLTLMFALVFVPPLPLYASPLHRVTTSNQPQRQPCVSLPEFPTLCGAVIPGDKMTT